MANNRLVSLCVVLHHGIAALALLAYHNRGNTMFLCRGDDIINNAAVVKMPREYNQPVKQVEIYVIIHGSCACVIAVIIKKINNAVVYYKLESLFRRKQ